MILLKSTNTKYYCNIIANDRSLGNCPCARFVRALCSAALHGTARRPNIESKA